MSKNIYFLMGNWFDRRIYLQKIKKNIGAYELYVYDDSYSYEYVLKSLLEYTCFGEKKLIILNDLPFIENTEPSKARPKILNGFKGALQEISDNTYVVFNGIEISSKTFFAPLEGKIELHCFDLMVEKRDALKHVLKFFGDIEKTIDNEQATIIIDSIDYVSPTINIDKLYLILKKIENFVGARKKITQEDVYSVCSLSEDFLIWSLFTCLDKKDSITSLKLIDKLISSSQNIESDVVIALATMIWRYRLFIFVKSCLLRKMSQEDVLKKVSIFTKWEKKGQGVKRVVAQAKNKDGTLKKMYSEGAYYSIFRKIEQIGKAPINCYVESELLQIETLIEKTLHQIRSGATDGEIRTALEIICLVICESVKYENALQIIRSKYCV